MRIVSRQRQQETSATAATVPSIKTFSFIRLAGQATSIRSGAKSRGAAPGRLLRNHSPSLSNWRTLPPSGILLTLIFKNIPSLGFATALPPSEGYRIKELSKL